MVNILNSFYNISGDYIKYREVHMGKFAAKLKETFTLQGGTLSFREKVALALPGPASVSQPHHAGIHILYAAVVSFLERLAHILGAFGRAVHL